MKEISFFKEKAVHFKSKSGSYYFYTEEGVYRYSNHWGRVANCRWKIKGVDVYKNQDFYVGYAKWNAFYPLNDTDKVFYIKVNFETKQAEILRINSEEKNENYTMNTTLVHLRLKQIRSLFKEYKWAIYIDAPIEELRKIMITKLVNCTTSLVVLKKELKYQFDKNE